MGRAIQYLKLGDPLVGQPQYPICSLTLSNPFVYKQGICIWGTHQFHDLIPQWVSEHWSKLSVPIHKLSNIESASDDPEYLGSSTRYRGAIRVSTVYCKSRIYGTIIWVLYTIPVHIWNGDYCSQYIMAVHLHIQFACTFDQMHHRSLLSRHTPLNIEPLKVDE